MQNAQALLKQRTYPGLFLAVIAVAFAAIFVRWVGDTPALMIAFYRMFWTSVLFLLLQLRHRQASPTQPLSRYRWHILLAGVMLALHFATWIGSLKYTTIAHALMLGSTGPVFALLLAPLLLSDKNNRWAFVAVVLASCGVLMIARGDTPSGDTALAGDILALSSAFFVTIYLLIGRMLREQVQLIPYLTRVYCTAALLLLGLGLLTGYPLMSYPLEAHFWMFMLALVPTGIGHTLFNWAARRIAVYKVNLAGLGEPLLASLLAYFFFAEIPDFWFYPGALLVLAGIVTALWKRQA